MTSRCVWINSILGACVFTVPASGTPLAAVAAYLNTLSILWSCILSPPRYLQVGPAYFHFFGGCSPCFLPGAYVLLYSYTNRVHNFRGILGLVLEFVCKGGKDLHGALRGCFGFGLQDAK